MKRLTHGLAAAIIWMIAILVVDGNVEAHDETHPESMQAVLPGQFFADVSGDFAHPDLDPVSTRVDAAELFTFPEQATNCIGGIKPSRTAAYAYCYNYSGSGSWQFQIAARAYDGCYRYIWFYGNVGYPYVPGKTTTRKDSYVYTPPGTWRFIAWKIIRPL